VTPVSVQVCPVHADESVAGETLGDGSVSYTCPRSRGHPEPGPYTWLHVPQPKGLPELTGIAAELGLDVELPRVLATFPEVWVEYGLVEYTYAQRNRKDFAALVDRYGHTAIKASRYTVSSFLAGTLGILSRDGMVLVRLPVAGSTTTRSRGGPCRQRPTGIVGGHGKVPALRWAMCLGVSSREAQIQAGSMRVAMRRRRHQRVGLPDPP
jgi:hypothetical protein